MERRGRELKKGQIQLSFGMIFSIIIIIATVAVAFYIISHFLSLNKCTQISFFYDDLQKTVDRMWTSDAASQTLSVDMPGDIESVCFGTLNQVAATGFKDEQDALKDRYIKIDKNVFIYPSRKACDGNLGYFGLKHAQTAGNQFFCVPVKNGKLNLKLSKGNFDALVTVNK